MALSRLAVIAAVSVALVAGATLVLLRPAPAPAPSLLRIGVIEWSGFYGVMRGHVEGRYAAIGLPVSVIAYPDNPTMNEALAAGSLDLACVVYADAIRLAASGTPLRTIGVLDWSDQGDVVLASPSLSVGELTGKRLAFERPNSFSHFFLLGFLSKHGLKEAQVQMVDLPAQQVPAAIADGRIDAGHTWGPLAEEAAAKGAAKVLDRAGLVPGWITEVVVSRTAVLEQRRPEVTRLLAEIYHLQPRDPAAGEAARAAAATFLGKPVAAISPVGAEAHIVDAALARILMHDPEHPNGLLRSGSMIVDAMAKRGQIPGDFPIPDLIDIGSLP